MAQRADARRNRAAILEAASELILQRGAEGLRIAEVASRAGVGAGSVYRAVHSKSGLLLAMLDEHEHELQELVIRGDPPLGPGAPPQERLLAFVEALHELVVGRRELLLAADDASALSHLRTGAHDAWRLHLRLLLTELRPEADPDVLAEVLLAPLSAATHVHLLDDLGIEPQHILTELLRLAAAIAVPPPDMA